jgi:hypothetical protein
MDHERKEHEMPQQYVVRDRFDVIEFEGDLIGSASTRKDEDQGRWTEIHIYRTTSGKYVVQRLGCSVVFHRKGKPCSSGEIVLGEDIQDESIGCSKCDPDTDFFDDGEYVHEVTMSSADVVSEPKDIRRVLVIKKEGRPEYLSSVAHSALQEAVRSDRALLGVFERRIRV